MNFKKNTQIKMVGKRLKGKFNALVTLSLAMMVLLLTSPLAEAAAKKTTPKLFTNTKTFLGDAGGWIIGIVGAVAGFYMIWLGLQYSINDDPGSRNEVKKKMKNVVIGIAISLSAASLIAVIVTYYT
ncbi:pilin [Exiguobacterium antarcticum]|uniref:Pilin n=1 Tax=Exiguobacterium antarcticum TaxID=132920 RepID=A0ABT6R4V1_9BACL|nr:pilin [Exiguobacterium antarcticum]MDI3235980.1 pilin [Exiguobacterium antarcticum]